MAADPLTAALNLGGQLIDRLWPDPEKRDQAKLALMEISALDELHAMGVTPRESARDAAVKASIIDRLKRI